MAGNRRMAPSRRGSVRRNRAWARDEFAVTPSATGAAVELLTDFRAELGTTANLPGITIGGVLLDFVVTNTSARAADGDFMTFGLLVTSEETAADVQGPLLEPHADWLWQQSIAAGPADGDFIDTFRALGGPVRIRAKRRMDEIGMRFYLVAQLSGLTTFTMSGVASTVLLLP